MKNAVFTKKSQQNLQFTVHTDLSDLPEVAVKNMQRFAVACPSEAELSSVRTMMPIPASLKETIASESAAAWQDHAEAFVVCKENDAVAVYADDDRGILYGLMSFLRLLHDDGTFDFEYVYDYPTSSFRGVKVLMPGRDEICYFKNLIDSMVFFRHNTIMIEIGGAMEYKRHPEINEGWEEYAAFMSEYSGKSIEIQEHTFPWLKNSIHSNNGAGSYLTQDEVKDLIAYCTERGVSIIPEVPSGSHCDYLLTRHPELAERPEDPYPDTYCVSNPDSYKLLFDVLDEVIEVFHPEVINIGHDEFYSINICDRCRKRIKKNYELYAEDVTKIHDYLAEKGVKTMIWSEKLLNVRTDDGRSYGGALNFIYEGYSPENEFRLALCPLWPAKNLIPKDVLCMNWYWSFGEKYDKEIEDFSVLFGNFSGYRMTNFRSRCGDNVTGGMCSDWGATSPVYLQRNCIDMCMAYNDRLYWDADYDDTNDEESRQAVDQCFKLLFDYHYGAPLNRPGRYIDVIHATDREATYCEFVDGIYTEGEVYRSQYYMGDYEIHYQDGTVCRQEVFLGENIGNIAESWYGKNIDDSALDSTPGVSSTRLSPKIAETAGTTLPMLMGNEIYYRYLMENPHPEKEVSHIDFVPVDGATWKVTVKQAELLKK